MSPSIDDDLARRFAVRIRAEADRIDVPDTWPAVRARFDADSSSAARKTRTRARLVPTLVAAGALVIVAVMSLLLVPSLRGPGPAAVPAPEPSQSAAAELTGRWSASWTRDELAASPLTGPGELNDGNWGTFSLDLRDGQGRETMWNRLESYDFAITYHTDGDVLTVDRDNGEHFVMRWRIDDEGRLILTRDDNLGEVPVAYVIEPLIH